jgi:hypothetical protein
MDCTPAIAGCSEYSSMMARPFVESSCNVCADGYLRQQNGYLSPDALGVVYSKYNCTAVVPALPKTQIVVAGHSYDCVDTPTTSPAPSVKAAAPSGGSDAKQGAMNWVFLGLAVAFLVTSCVLGYLLYRSKNPGSKGDGLRIELVSDGQSIA